MPDDRLAAPRLEPFHLTLDGQKRFCIFHASHAARDATGSILYVHPFGEEMNKARRMAALQSRALARAGWSVLQLDLAGCGDSEGEFGDASWRRWIDDVSEAAAWLEERTRRAPWLWGLRTGCLIVADAARAMGRSADLVLWQPVLSGKQFLQHLLRMRLAAQLVGAPDATRNNTSTLREELARGSSLTVAGYDLSPALALGLEASELGPPPVNGRVAWLEVSSGEEAELSPASATRAEAWRRAGHRVETRAVSGEAFWQTQEIAECEALIDATLEALVAIGP